MNYCNIEDAYDINHTINNCVYDNIINDSINLNSKDRSDNQNDDRENITDDNISIYSAQGDMTTYPQYVPKNGTEVSKLIKQNKFMQNLDSYYDDNQYRPVDKSKTEYFSPVSNTEITQELSSVIQPTTITRPIIDKKKIENKKLDNKKKVKTMHLVDHFHLDASSIQSNFIIMLTGIIIILIVDLIVRISRRL
jgi:hypothetical protein